ncbi:MAG: hypothetical protein ACI91B_002724 [Planctomycetota bacterium]|jgi:hypothetical protein
MPEEMPVARTCIAPVSSNRARVLTTSRVSAWGACCRTDPSTAYTDAQQTVDVATIAGIVADMAVLAALDRAPVNRPPIQTA